MTPDELERLAKDHKELPQHTILPDACYYWTMRALWDSLKAGKITRDKAVDEKRIILRQYQEFKAEYDNMCRVYREEQANIRKIGTLRTLISDSDEPLKKLKHAIEAIGAMTGDKVFERIELQMIEQLEVGDK